MCPPLSCCHWRHRGPLPTALYQLARLLLAAPAELPVPQRPALEPRLDALWDQLEDQVARRLSPGAAPAVTGELLAVLLQDDCCRQALRRSVPLAEALGPGPVLSQPPGELASLDRAA
jgi:hypothetical protein